MGYVLEALLDVLMTVNYTTTAMIENITGTSSKLDGMTTQVANIRNISDSMNLLALNAIIKVARTGSAGHGLGVLAEEISKQSKSAQERIAEGAKVINDVLSTSAEFTRQLNIRLMEQVASSELITGEANKALEKLMEGDKELMTAMSGISHSARRLETEIAQVISGISFDKIIREKLTAAADEIEAVLTEVRDKIPDDIYEHTDFTPDLNDMLQRYTMDSERLIHKDSLGQADDGADALFFGDDGDGSKKKMTLETILNFFDFMHRNLL